MIEKFTIIGDPHVTNKNLDFFKQLTQIVEHKNNPVIWLGDFLDTKEMIRGKSLNTLLEYFKHSKLQHYILIGNHDWFNHDCQEHSLESLRAFDNVCLVDHPVALQDENMLLIPYYHDHEILKKIIEKGESGSILVGHLEVGGFDYGNGYICKEGLQISELSKFKKVISGHFHAFQEKENLVYLGTPFSHSFGESNQKKYIGTLNVATKELSLEESPFRHHITMEIDLEKGEHLILCGKEHLYRVFLKGQKEKISEFDKKQFSEYNVTWFEKPTEDSHEILIDEKLDNLSQFDYWASEIADLSNEARDLGLAILRSVSDN